LDRRTWINEENYCHAIITIIISTSRSIIIIIAATFAVSSFHSS